MVWPASGLAIAAVWWGGHRLVPAIGLGTFIFAWLNGAPLPAGAGVSFANMIEASLAVFLMRRCIGGRGPLDRVNDVFCFFLLAGVVAPAVSAAVGVASACLGGAGRWEDFNQLCLLWWAGHSIGTVIAAPAALAWARPDKSRWTAGQRAEAAVVFLLLTFGCALIFGAKEAPLGAGFPAAFPILPVIAWAAIRLGQRATVSATLLVGVLAVWGTLRGMGPFMEAGTPLTSVLHVFIATTAMTGLALAASVNERNEAESAAHEKEARKATILETAFDAILSIDHTGKVQEWNPAAERIFGYRRGEAVGRFMDELIVSDELRRTYPGGLADYLMTGVGSLIGRPFEIMARHGEAREFPVELAITRVPASEPPVYTVVARDLTRRKQAEAALRQSEERLRLIIESVTDYGIYMLDCEGRVATWNAGAERLKGYPAGEIIGKSFSTFFTPEDVQRGAPGEILKRAKEEGHAVYEGPRVRKDGSRFWVQGMITTVRDETGKWVGFAKVAHDITELKRREEALRQSEARFRALVEGAPQLIWTAGPDGVCDYVSPQWRHYTGVAGEKLIGWDGVLEYVHPEDRETASSAWKRALETNRPLDAEFRIRGKNGEYRWFRARAVPVRDAEGEVVKWIGSNTDIDDQTRAREALETTVRERTAELRTSLNSTEELLYTIAHDLRAPNRTMQGFAQLLQAEQGPRLDDNARDYLNRISSAAVRNDEMIRDLLEYGRLSHEAAPLAPVDLRRTVEAALRALNEEIQKHNARIQLGQEWPLALANEPMLKQALTHLLTNALLYAPPEREPEIVISASAEDDQVALRVKDNGIGIAPEQIDRAFKPFIRLPNTINAPGTGMGLAITKKAAERMNGSAGAESSPGKGSCFWLRLPAASPRPEKPGGTAQ